MSLTWTTAARGARVVPVLLVAGLDQPITPPGVAFATVSCLPDAAWHVGTAALVPYGWLALPTGGGDDPPALAIEERAQPVKAAVDVSAVTVWLEDVAGQVTDVLWSRRSLPRARLAATLDVGGLTVTVESGAFAGLTPPFTVHCGREALRCTARSVAAPWTLTVLRGRSGTRERRHVVGSGVGSPWVYGPPAAGEALPAIVGRRATLWAARLVGTDVTELELLFDGRVGAGVVPHGAYFEVPLDHASKELEVSFQEETLALAGWHHPAIAGTGAGAFTPLEVSNTNVPTILHLDDTDNGGWHPSPESFVAAFRAKMGAGPAPLMSSYVTVDLVEGGLAVRSFGCGATDITTVWVCWGDLGAGWLGNRSDDVEGLIPAPDGSMVGSGGVPQVIAWLSGVVHLAPQDAVRVPSVPTAPATGVQVWWGLEAIEELAEGARPRRARITAVAGDTVTLAPLGGRTVREMLVLGSNGATVRMLFHVEATTWDDALRYGVTALGEQLGLDWLEASIDWTSIAAVAARTLGGILAPGRRFDVEPDTSVIDLIRREAGCQGYSLVLRGGRLSFARIAQVAATEPSVATITPADLLDDGTPVVVEARDGLATRVVYTFPKDPEGRSDTLTVVDAAAEGEGGRGTAIEVEVPGGALDRTAGVIDARVQVHLVGQAQHLLGPWRYPYRQVSVRLPLTFGAVGVGDVVTLTDWLTPDDAGGRGLSSATCVVLGRRLDLTAGELALDLLVSEPSLAGYAPEALVSGIAGAVLTIDNSFIADHGFADDLLADGNTRTDGGTSTFTVGDAVVLMEMDATAPAAPFTALVVAVDPVAHTIELDAAPGAGWAALAGTPGKVLLAFDGYTSASAAQRRYAYTCDGTTLVLGAADDPKRFAA